MPRKTNTQSKRVVHNRKSSVAGNLSTFTDMSLVIEPPRKVPAAVAEYFQKIIQSRELRSWTDAQIETALILAQNFVDIEEATNTLEAEGLTLVNRFGEITDHPSFLQRQKMIATNARLTGLLGLSATALEPNRNEAQARMIKEREMKTVSKGGDQSGLLA